MRLYQKEKTNLVQYENRIQELENKIKQGQIKADTSKTTWLNQVNEMIDQINAKFVDLFNTMGCKGQVCLDIPETPVRLYLVEISFYTFFQYRMISKSMVLILKFNFVMEKNYTKW